MKKALGLTLSLVFASHAWADDTTRSRNWEQPDDIVFVGGVDCSLGVSRSRMPEVATAVAVVGVIVVHDLLSNRSIGSAVQRDGWRVVELGRKQRSRVPRWPAGGWRQSGRSVFRR